MTSSGLGVGVFDGLAAVADAAAAAAAAATSSLPQNHHHYHHHERSRMEHRVSGGSDDINTDRQVDAPSSNKYPKDKKERTEGRMRIPITGLRDNDNNGNPRSTLTANAVESSSSNNEADVSNSNTTSTAGEEDDDEDYDNDYDDDDDDNHHDRPSASSTVGRNMKEKANYTATRPSGTVPTIAGNVSQQQINNNSSSVHRRDSNSGSGTEASFSSLSGEELKPSKSKMSMKISKKRKQLKMQLKQQKVPQDQNGQSSGATTTSQLHDQKKKQKLNKSISSSHNHDNSDDDEDDLLCKKNQDNNNSRSNCRIVGTGSIADTSKNASEAGSPTASSSSMGVARTRPSFGGKPKTIKNRNTGLPDAVNVNDACSNKNNRTYDDLKISVHDNCNDNHSSKQDHVKYVFEGMSTAQSYLCTVEGQLAKNPGMSREEAKEAAKREYNRRNAARARVRNKDMVKSLQRRVNELTKLTSDLQRTNEILRSQLEILASSGSKTNDATMASKNDIGSSTAATTGPVASALATVADHTFPTVQSATSTVGMMLPGGSGVLAKHPHTSPKRTETSPSKQQLGSALGTSLALHANGGFSGVSTPTTSLQMLQQQQQQQQVANAVAAVTAAATTATSKNPLYEALAGVSQNHILSNGNHQMQMLTATAPPTSSELGATAFSAGANVASTTNMIAAMLQRSIVQQQLAAAAVSATSTQPGSAQQQQQSGVFQPQSFQHQQQPLSYTDLMLAQIQKIVAEAQSSSAANQAANTSASSTYIQQPQGGWLQMLNNSNTNNSTTATIPTQIIALNGATNPNVTPNVEAIGTANPFQKLLEALALNNGSIQTQQQQSLTTSTTYNQGNKSNESALNPFLARPQQQSGLQFQSNNGTAQSATRQLKNGVDPNQTCGEGAGVNHSNEKALPVEASPRQTSQASYVSVVRPADAAVPMARTTVTGGDNNRNGNTGSSSNASVGVQQQQHQQQHPWQGLFQNIAPETLFALLREHQQQQKP